MYGERLQNKVLHVSVQSTEGVRVEVSKGKVWGGRESGEEADEDASSTPQNPGRRHSDVLL